MLAQHSSKSGFRWKQNPGLWWAFSKCQYLWTFLLEWFYFSSPLFFGLQIFQLGHCQCSIARSGGGGEDGAWLLTLNMPICGILSSWCSPLGLLLPSWELVQFWIFLIADVRKERKAKVVAAFFTGFKPTSLWAPLASCFSAPFSY